MMPLHPVTVMLEPRSGEDRFAYMQMSFSLEYAAIFEGVLRSKHEPPITACKKRDCKDGMVCSVLPSMGPEDILERFYCQRLREILDNAALVFNLILSVCFVLTFVRALGLLNTAALGLDKMIDAYHYAFDVCVAWGMALAHKLWDINPLLLLACSIPTLPFLMSLLPWILLGYFFHKFDGVANMMSAFLLTQGISFVLDFVKNIKKYKQVFELLIKAAASGAQYLYRMVTRPKKEAIKADTVKPKAE